jgi:hypothetical protein
VAATTTTVSRAWAAPTDFVNCSLSRVLANSSHLLAVTTAEPVVTHAAVQPMLGDVVVEDTVMATVPPALVDTATATVTEVIGVRADDPRSRFFPSLARGGSLSLSSPIAGSVLADIAGRPTLVAVGQYMLGTVEEWHLYAALDRAGDGSVSFLGPCGPELDRQLAALATGFGARPDVAFLDRMIAEELQPGRTLDVDYFTRPEGSRAVGSESMPPAIAGKLRVIGLYLTPTGSGRGIVGMYSTFGISGLSTIQAAGGASWLEAAAVPKDGAAQFVLYDADHIPGQVTRVLLDLSADQLRGVDAIHVTLDTTTMAATWEPLDVDRLAALAGWTVAGLQSYKVQYQAQLDTPGKATPQVDFFEQAPVTS